MNKSILLGLLLAPCVTHTMEEEYYACNYEDGQRIVYSLGNPNIRFQQVTYNKKEMELPKLVTLLYGARTLTMGSKSQSVFNELRAAYQKRKNPISRYEDAERIVYTRGNRKTYFEQVTCDKKEEELPTLRIRYYGHDTYTMGSSSLSKLEELKAACAQQQKEIEAEVNNK